MKLVKAVQAGNEVHLRCECMGDMEEDAIYDVASVSWNNGVASAPTGDRSSRVRQALREFALLHLHKPEPPEVVLPAEGIELHLLV